MKKLIIALLLVLPLTSCHKSLQDQAEEQAREYTRKNCPTPEKNFVRMDSMTFDRATNTFSYWYSFTGQLDDKAVIDASKAKARDFIIKEVREDTKRKIYKDAGFTFRYVYHSASRPQTILLDIPVKQKDYR